MTAVVHHAGRCQIRGFRMGSGGSLAAGNTVYLSHTFVDIKVEFPAHIETNPVAVARLVVYVDERNLDGIRALWVKRHPVRSTVFGVGEEFVNAFSCGELSFNFVRLLPSASLRCHLGSWRSSLSVTRMVATAHAYERRKPAARHTGSRDKKWRLSDECTATITEKRLGFYSEGVKYCNIPKGLRPRGLQNADKQWYDNDDYWCNCNLAANYVIITCVFVLVLSLPDLSTVKH